MQNVYSKIEKLISLAVDTGISDIIITGDFDLNVLNSQTKKKIDSFCTKFSLHQPLTDPSHFTEHSSSLINLILVGGAVVEGLTRDRGVAGSSLTGVTALWSLSKAHLS